MSENLIQIEKSYISRSAILEHFVCPYKHYLTYWAQGTGFHPNKQNLDLLIGTVVHRGLQHLFEHCRIEHPDGDFTETCVDEAVEIARELWEKELSKKPLALKSSQEYDRLEWIIAEQECLWEALIRAFAIHRLPSILEQYDILEVEKEEVYEEFTKQECDLCIDGTVSFPVAEHYIGRKLEGRDLIGFTEDPTKIVCPKCNGTLYWHPIVFLGKADGLFLSKAEKNLVVLSIKTTSQYAEVTTRDIMHDMQGVSETFLTQERLGREFEEFSKWWSEEKFTLLQDSKQRYFQECYSRRTKPKVFGVQYEYLIKGQRRQDPKDSGEYRQQSFLCHPLKFDGIRKIFLGNKGSSLNPDEYKWKWGAGKQPKGWEKTDIWSDIGIKNWITLLATGQIQPEMGHPFDSILHSPDLIVRSEMELKEWLISTRYIANEIRRRIELIYGETRKLTLDNVINGDYEKLQEMLWQFFPKNTLSCHDFYGKDCQFVRHCHELESMEDLINADEMVVREPHHEAEKESFIEKGLLEND